MATPGNTQRYWETYSLYTLACKAYIVTDISLSPREATDIQKAMDDALTGYSGIVPARMRDGYLSVPGIIILRIRNYDHFWIGDPWYRGCRDAFLWKILWINPLERYGPNRPDYSGVAIIEDNHCDFDNWGRDDNDPTHALYRRYSEPRYRGRENRRMLHSTEVCQYFYDNYTPCELCPIIESVWWQDAHLPSWLVDGVPESQEHSEYRQRPSVRGDYFALSDREYLDEPDWEDERVARDGYYDRDRRPL